MSKKIFIVASSALLVIAAIVCAVFLLNTRDLEPDDGEISFVGTWRVFAKGNADQPIEYFVFSETDVKDYRNNSTTHTFESPYTVSGTTITITNLAQDFTIESKTETTRLLYNSNVEYLIVKCDDNAHTANKVYNQSDLQGEYDVVLHANGLLANEKVIFNGDNFTCLREGNLFLEATYSLTNNVLAVGPLKFYVCKASDGIIRLTQIAENAEYFSWEMTLVK